MDGKTGCREYMIIISTRLVKVESCFGISKLKRLLEWRMALFSLNFTKFIDLDRVPLATNAFFLSSRIPSCTKGERKTASFAFAKIELSAEKEFQDALKNGHRVTLYNLPDRSKSVPRRIGIIADVEVANTRN